MAVRISRLAEKFPHVRFRHEISLRMVVYVYIFKVMHVHGDRIQFKKKSKQINKC